jgi:hypothetical protein
MGRFWLTPPSDTECETFLFIPFYRRGPGPRSSSARLKGTVFPGVSRQFGQFRFLCLISVSRPIVASTAASPERPGHASARKASAASSPNHRLSYSYIPLDGHSTLASFIWIRPVKITLSLEIETGQTASRSEGINLLTRYCYARTFGTCANTDSARHSPCSLKGAGPPGESQPISGRRSSKARPLSLRLRFTRSSSGTEDSDRTTGARKSGDKTAIQARALVINYYETQVIS